MTEQHNLSDKSARALGLIATGHTYEQIVSSERDITYLDIFTAAEEALRLSGTAASRDRLAEIKAQYPNAYEPWKPEDDAALAEMYRSGADVQAMEERFLRQPSAIRSRLSKLDLE